MELLRAVARFAALSLLIALAVWVDNKLLGQSAALSETDKRNQFEKYVRPALNKYCLQCHSADTQSNGGLMLDSQSGWEKGGDSGSAVVPGSADESLLIKAIWYNDPKLKMPPDQKLPADVIAKIEDWCERWCL